MRVNSVIPVSCGVTHRKTDIPACRGYITIVKFGHSVWNGVTENMRATALGIRYKRIKIVWCRL